MAVSQHATKCMEDVARAAYEANPHAVLWYQVNHLFFKESCSNEQLFPSSGTKSKCIHQALPVGWAGLRYYNLQCLSFMYVCVQLYILKDRALTAQLLRRAVSAGYKAITLTVDSCRFGSREADW